MAVKLDQEARMTIKELAGRGVPGRQIARMLGVREGAVRYHLARQAAGATDGRARQESKARPFAAAIDHWLAAQGESAALDLAALHAWLVAEHGYRGSLRSLQRYFRRHHPRPALRARRRVETPPGAQAQADWAEYRGVVLAGETITLYAFHLVLSHSRYEAIVWSPRKDLLSWLHVHNEAWRRLGGVAATVRVDNEKTVMARGAGVWGEIHPSYGRYAETVGFHIDVCPPRCPGHKGKVERRILDQRFGGDPRRREWTSLAELQAWTDALVAASAARRTCPATGTAVADAWAAERSQLAPLPVELPEPFDHVARRRVALDCTVAFEGRTYSVPFALVGQTVEVRGASQRVQILAGARLVASHPRHTAARVVLDPRHYEGESTPTVVAPPPLGRLGRRLQQIAELVPERRPLSLYAALAEVAR